MLNAAARPSRAKSSAVALLSRHAGALGVAAIVSGVSSWLAVGFSSRIRDWGVMTDELLYVKLAISAATRHSPLPVVHGQVVGTINQLYPLLLAPFFGALDDPGAFRAAHILNAPLMASAAIPAYLLARRLVDKRAALAVALLSVVVVWMVLTGFLMIVSLPLFPRSSVRGGSTTSARTPTSRCPRRSWCRGRRPRRTPDHAAR